MTQSYGLEHTGKRQQAILQALVEGALSLPELHAAVKCSTRDMQQRINMLERRRLVRRCTLDGEPGVCLTSFGAAIVTTERACWLRDAG